MNRVISLGIGVTALSLVALSACSDDGERRTSTGSSGTNTASSSGSNTPGASSGTPGASSGTPAGGIGELKGDVTANTTLTKDKLWKLTGLVAVKSGFTLTIEAGTTIQGSPRGAVGNEMGILLVEPGAKIMAKGTADEPIVFTSTAAEGARRPGDWGGILILGNAPVNYPGGKGSVEGLLKTVKGAEFGGSNEADDSGVFSYVRIEYAGVELSKDNEVNGLTLAGVGNKTQLDHVQVRMALDDCFEFFGGTVNGHHLACQYNQDDGFDFDNGYRGKLQFLVLQQDPEHPGEDNGFESDNDANGSQNAPLTAPQVWNATLCGKNKKVDSTQYGMLLRRNSRGNYENIVVRGFAASLDIRDEATKMGVMSPGVGEPALTLKHSLFFGSYGQDVVDAIAFPESNADKAMAPNYDNDKGLDEVAWFKTADFGNKWTDPQISGCFNATAPVFGPTSAIAGVAPPSDGFFDPAANYVGAFKDASDTWATAGKWARWDSK